MLEKNGTRYNFMDNQNAVMVIVAVCAAILLIGALKRQKEWLINLLFRTVTGTLGIFSSIWGWLTGVCRAPSVSTRLLF